ncbi:MAG: response regulator [Candidatus Omnitrophica bacterium]|nr:response regulator [Candidatus Omnitrophota bacterium]
MPFILVCSSDEKLRNLISTAFPSTHEIILSQDSDSCLDIFYDFITKKNNDIKMCILDIDEQKNALDIIEDFHLNYPHIRIIVIGKALSAELAQDAVRYGADGYLIKPIERETLISLI